MFHAQTCETRGRHWVPVLIMVLLVSIGTCLFFLLPGQHDTTMVDNSTPWFSEKNGILYFDESKYTGSEELVIPETLQGVPITAISDGCFQNCTDFSAVYLPASLKAIGESAFQGCTSLRGISIPKNVTFIGHSAFYGCIALEAVELSDQVKRIGDDTFTNCIRLKYIFYSGSFSSWAELYSENIGPDTAISCKDGIFPQSNAG